MKHFAMTTSKLAPKVTVWAVICYHIGSYFATGRGEKMYTTRFSWKIVLITRIWRKSVFRVWQLSTLVSIKMSVSSLLELHTPQQILSLSIVRKEQPLFKSVTRLNPVFQVILTIIIASKNDIVQFLISEHLTEILSALKMYILKCS